MSRSDLKLPLAVEIEISSYCNRKCAYCPNSRLERPEQGDMDPALFRKILDQLSELGYRGRISYHFYNEPLMSPRLEEYVTLTREALPECRIELFTNGTLLDRQKLGRLIGLGVDKFTVTRHAGTDLRAFEEAFSELPDPDRNRIRYKDQQNLFFTSRGGLVPGIGSAKVTPPLRRVCFVPYTVAVITLKGNVVPCFEDYLQKNVMGNVNEARFGEIWMSPKYLSFRESLKRGERASHAVCMDCDYILVVS